VGRWRAFALGALALATGLVLGLDLAGVVHGPLESTFHRTSFADEAVPGVVPVALTSPVLAPVAADGSSAPTPAGVQRALARLLTAPALGSRVGVVVLDPSSGLVLLDRGGNRAITPASTTKLLTAVTALSTLGPDTRLTTRVADSGGSGIVLVGAGDATLATEPARGATATSLTALADRTATQLRSGGRTSVRLAFDDSAFTGPRVAPQWPPVYVATGVVAPVSALSVDAGRVAPKSQARVPDPARKAADTFARLLRARRITVTGAVVRAKAEPSATTVAEVSSAPVSELVERMLTLSDDDLAESLAHLAGGRSSGSASFAGGVAATRSVLADLGVPSPGLVLVDGSGLSRTDRISPLTLSGVLEAAAAPRNPGLRATITGLAVAGLSGTLDARFDGAATRTARGITRGKTGTLTGVTSLAGTLVDADGHLLVYVVVADAVPAAGQLSARQAVDRVVARLAACGCR